MQGSFGPGRGHDSGHRPSQKTAPISAARAARRGLLFWLGEPFIGRVRRETPAKFHYWKCVLYVSLPAALLAGLQALTTFPTVSGYSFAFIAPCTVTIACGVTSWCALDELVFDAEARRARNDAKQGLQPPGCPYDNRGSYQRRQVFGLFKATLGLVAMILTFVLAPPLVEHLPPVIGTMSDYRLLAHAIPVTLGLLALSCVVEAIGNLLFGGFEMMRERAIRQGIWRGEMP